MSDMLYLVNMLYQDAMQTTICNCQKKKKKKRYKSERQKGYLTKGE